MLDLYATIIREALSDAPSTERLRRLQLEAVEASARGPSGSIMERLALSKEQLQIIWTLAAISAIPGIRDLVQLLNATRSGDPTMETLRQIAFGSKIDLRSLNETGSQSSLQTLGLVQRSDGDEAAPHRQTWTLAPRVLTFLLGAVHALDPAVQTFAAVNAGDVPGLDQLALDARSRGALEATFARGVPFVQVYGLAGLGRRTVLRAFSHSRSIAVFEIDCTRLAKEDAALRVQLRLVAREALLLGLAPLLVGMDELSPTGRRLVVDELVVRLSSCGFLATSRTRIDLRSPVPIAAVELVTPATSDLVSLWRHSLGSITDADAAHLGARYPLAPSRIVRASRLALETAGAASVSESSVVDAIGNITDDAVGDFGHRLATSQTWDDLVLPADQAVRITELVARVRDRITVFEHWGFRTKVGKGLGICALFSGPPGCGKSMCAGLIANELMLPMYAVDSSKINSKWIGETEKNLAAVFDAAEATCSILLFDEADALFGKRSDVKSSNDKHANSEVSYLLQRLEKFTGVCILTSNHESALDPAFQRRLAVHVRFELPDEPEREQLWRAMIPATAPISKAVDFEDLAARYAMSGGYIRNAVLRAAFLAASSAGEITPAQLHHAARLECEAMGRVVRG